MSSDEKKIIVSLRTFRIHKRYRCDAHRVHGANSLNTNVDCCLIDGFPRDRSFSTIALFPRSLSLAFSLPSRFRCAAGAPIFAAVPRALARLLARAGATWLTRAHARTFQQIVMN